MTGNCDTCAGERAAPLPDAQTGSLHSPPGNSMDRVTDFESGGNQPIRCGDTENRVVGSIQSPIFGGFLPLLIPKTEKVDLQ